MVYPIVINLIMASVNLNPWFSRVAAAEVLPTLCYLDVKSVDSDNNAVYEIGTDISLALRLNDEKLSKQVVDLLSSQLVSLGDSSPSYPENPLTCDKDSLLCMNPNLGSTLSERASSISKLLRYYDAKKSAASKQEDINLFNSAIELVRNSAKKLNVSLSDSD